MEKERTTRRSLLRALYLLPLVCISLALNAQTKVVYVNGNAQSDQTPKKVVGRVFYDNDTLKYEGALAYENLYPEKEITWDMEAYKLPDGKSVDELIESLPGVQADENGNITINGKPVRRILVNGKEYNSGDPNNIYASRIVEEVEGEIPDGHNRVTTVTVNENGQVSITSEDKPEQAEPANNSAKIIDENGIITIDTQNGVRVNLNGTQTTK